MKKKIANIVALILLLNCFITAAWAGQAFINQKNVVNEGQKVGNIFLYGEDGVISGQVTDEVVVINGNLTLTKTAWIKDRVFLLGGKLIQEPGAQVGKGIFHFNVANQNLNSLFIAGAALVVFEIAKFVLVLLIVLAGIGSLFILKKKVNKAKILLEDNFLKTGLLGLLAAIGISFILVAFALTIWGIVVAILLALFILILLPIGLGALSLIIGEIVLKNFVSLQKPVYYVLAGSLLMAALLNLPLLGVLWGILIFIFSLGALTLSVLPAKIS